MFRNTCIVLVAALFVVSCGKSKTALTPEQKQQVVGVVESQGRVNKAAEKVTGSKPRNRGGLLAAEIQQTPQQTDQLFVQKLSSADCIPQMTEMKGFDDGQMDLSKPITFGYSLKGDRCPATFSFAMTMKMSQQEMNMALDMSFLVKDEELKKLNDVYGLTLKGEIKGTQKGGGGELKGSISSQKHGEIPTSISLSASESGAEVVWNLEIPGAPAEIKFVVSDPQNPKVEYFLNGEPMTKQEFEAQFKNKGGELFAFSPQKSVQSTQQSKTPATDAPVTPTPESPTPLPFPGGWWISRR